MTGDVKQLPLNDIQLLAKAFNFSAHAHRYQKRKDPEASPYIVHPAALADVLAQHDADAITIVAALLHDTVEDTDATFEEIEHEFGKEIADIVREVTGDKSLPKDTRKELEVAHAATASRRAKMVKIADKADNLKNFPPDWTQERISGYFVWAKRVVDNCRGVHPGLEAHFDYLYKTLKP